MAYKYFPGRHIEKCGIENLDARTIRILAGLAIEWLKNHNDMIATVPEEFKDEFKEFEPDIKEMEEVRDICLGELKNRNLTLE